MFKFFSFNKKQKENPQISEKLDRIIELLENQQREKNIHIDHIQIDHLENIIFRLDNIEIDELSGKFTIGNNIMSAEDLTKPIVQKLNKENAKKEALSDISPPDHEKFVKTSKGYRIRND